MCPRCSHVDSARSLVTDIVFMLLAVVLGTVSFDRLERLSVTYAPVTLSA